MDCHKITTTIISLMIHLLVVFLDKIFVKKCPKIVEKS